MSNWRKTYYSLLVGQSVSKFTSSILQFTMIWYVNETTNSPLFLSIAMLFGFLPRAILGSFVGVFIDRYERKTVMIVSDLFIAFVSLLPLLSKILTGNISIYFIYAVLLLRSLGTAFHEPATQAVIPQIVPKNELIKAAGFAQAIDSISMIISPFVSSFLYAFLEFSTIILLDFFGALFAVIVLTKLKIPSNIKIKGKILFHQIYREAAEGFKVLKSNKGLMGLVIMSSFYSLALMPVSALFPYMSTSYFGGNEFHTGLVETIFAVGLMIGAIVLSITGGTKNKVHTIATSCFIMSASLFVSGVLSPTQFVIFAISAFFMGFSGPLFWSVYRPLLQGGFDEQYLGRVLSLANSITVIASPIGMLVSGLFSEFFGASRWFLLAGLMTAVCGIVCLCSPDIRNAGITEGVENSNAT